MEKDLLEIKARKKTARRKSRTSNRPALRSNGIFSEEHFVMKTVFIAGYALAVFILFQFISVHFVYGFYESSVLTGPIRIAAAAVPAKKVQVSAPVVRGLPVRIKIPSIRVNAVIGQVGLAKDGSMGVPKLPRDTAWYKFGPKPGEIGSAVIAGHVNWWNGAAAVFARLKNLKIGSVITVQDSNGVVNSFIVKSIREYNLKDNATDVFLSYDGKSHLNLVTCTGVWNKLTKMYSKRLVVFADKVEE